MEEKPQLVPPLKYCAHQAACAPLRASMPNMTARIKLQSAIIRIENSHGRVPADQLLLPPNRDIADISVQYGAVGRVIVVNVIRTKG